jgi:hypothetical protein
MNSSRLASQSSISIRREDLPATFTTGGKMKKRFLLFLTLVVVVLATVIPVSAHPLSASWEPSACPVGWAAQPCQRAWVSVKVYEGYGTSWGCVALDDNPFGYYQKYTIYSGWWYKDARGTTYYTWFRDADRGAVMGPETVVNKFSSTVCGIP